MTREEAINILKHPKKKQELELLNKEFPTLKKAIEEWQKYEKENK